MVVSLAWYQTDTNPSPAQFKLGPVTLSLTGVYIGIMSGLMTFPINFIIVLIFRYSAPKPEKKKDFKPNIVEGDTGEKINQAEIKSLNDKSIDDNSRDPKAPSREGTEISIMRERSELNPDFVEFELREQEEFLDTGDETKCVMSKDPITKEDQAICSDQTQFSHNTQIVAFEKDGEKKRKKRLPWWCIYVGYILSFITVVVAFYFAVEFGGVFGLEKSVSWLVGFIMSLIESVFFSQPIKVIIIAIFYALVIKKPEAQDDDDIQLKPDLRNDEEYLHDHLTEKDLEDPQKLRLLEQRKTQATLPPELDFLKTIREER
jgi:polycystin 1L2